MSMTTAYKIEHEFPSVPLEVFEEYLNHPKLNEMLSEMPSFKSRELIETQALKNGEKHWCFQVSAGGKLPPAVEKIASADLFSWQEKSRFVPKEHTLHFSIEPLKSNKFVGSGKFIFSKHKNGTKRILEGEMNVKIPFVGRVVENFLISELKKNYEAEPKIQTKFYKKMMQA